MQPRNLIESFEAKEDRRRPLAIKLADYLTSVFGGITFLVFNFIFFTTWILVNTGQVRQIPVFDPFPFPFLTMAVSLEAIILSIIVLMSQSRQSYISNLREEIDIQINLIAEREITKALFLLSELIRHHGIKIDDPELGDMLKRIDTSYIERRLQSQLGSDTIHPVRQVVKEIEKTVKKIAPLT